MHRYSLLTGLSIGITFLFSACGKSNVVLLEMSPLVQHASYALSAEIPASITTGTAVPVRLHLTKNGQPWDTAQDYRMLHVILASADLEDMRHFVQPEQGATGTYTFSHRFTRPGRYRLWVEVDDVQADEHHGQDADLLATAEWTVAGDTLPSDLPSTEENAVTASGFTLMLLTPGFTSGITNDLRFAVVDREGKKIALAPADAIVFAATDVHLRFFDHGHLLTAEDGFSGGIPLTPLHPGPFIILVQATFTSPAGDDVHTLEGHFLVHVR